MSVAVLQEARRAPVRETPTHYDFVPLTPGELSAWDILIRPYDSRELFHSQAWLDYLATDRPCTLATPQEARMTLEATLAIEHSMRIGAAVTLPLRAG